MIITLLATVVVLSILVFLHETGHFAAAKLFGMRVERFSIGYPPRLAGKKIGDTDYCISAVPFGGYVKISGMVDESFDKEQLSKKPEPWEYRSRPWIQRFTVIFAGPLMNILFALIIFIGAVMIYGVAVQKPGTEIGQVMDKMPAAEAGLMPGDKIVEVDNHPVETWKAEKISIWHPGHHDNPLGMRLTTLMISKKIPDSSVPMSLLADHPNVQFNFYRPGLGSCEVEMH